MLVCCPGIPQAERHFGVAKYSLACDEAERHYCLLWLLRLYGVSAEDASFQKSTNAESIQVRLISAQGSTEAEGEIGGGPVSAMIVDSIKNEIMVCGFSHLETLLIKLLLPVIEIVDVIVDFIVNDFQVQFHRRNAFVERPELFTPPPDEAFVAYVVENIQVMLIVTLQHLPFSPATNPGYPGRLVAGDKFPGRLVAWDRSSGKALRGYLPGRLTRATSWGPHSFSQTNICHGGGVSRATCRPGY
ncbi:hypothetical protein Tco_0449448 [Tanacetum coccineum]